MDELSNRLGLHEDDIDVGLSVRSTHLRRYEVLQSWSADSVPFDPWSPHFAKLTGLQSGRGMDFILAIRVVADRKKLLRQGLSRGKVLCRKVFSVKETIDTFSFPFQWAQFGGETDYPEEALWAIKWIYHDDDNRFARPVDQVLTVLVNEKAEGPLCAMSEVQQANDLAWRMLAADITTQIWADVLSNLDEEPDENDTETLVGQVFARLSSISGMPYAEIKGLVKQDDSLMELRNLVARILKVVG